ncbi:hypothetical protein NXC12_PD00032 (plasmid) [Rhizobium etli]|uniref:Uncharacterized protein n=1 Tax=Rhizobium etli TaxID=29449 RepID=A0AAN1BKW7_RHIET|nr:hypothetical protein [Rhizobium etli]ARQ13145.1 hypothetical protein NXC12_PD00032 [Rhizobium etli]
MKDNKLSYLTLTGFLALLGLFAAIEPSFAQNCPTGFALVREESLKRNTGQGSGFELLRVELPRNRDRSYAQSNAIGRLTGSDDSGNMAQTPWDGQHNIRGIWLEATGNYHYALGVKINGRDGRPHTIAEVDPATGEVVREYLEIGAYCGPGGNGQGCTATIKVCYKPK